MKKLAIYDFDGTLMNSPEPNPGKQIWKEKTGEEYPHKGWWGRKESLDTDVFEIKPIPSILSKFNKDVNDPNTITIILTSRLEKLRPEVEKILKLNNIHPDKLIMKWGGDDKGDVILKLVNQYDDIGEIVVYDDFAGGMENKIREFIKIKDSLDPNINYNIYYVENGKVSLMETTNHCLKIINEEIEKFIKK